MALVLAPEATFGDHLRAWRERRRMSQLELSAAAEVSTRHLSYLETGRSKPSREMVIHLAEHLEVPLHDQNQMLVAAGFAPVYRRRALDDPAMAVVRSALQQVLDRHDPLPAAVVDRGWDVVMVNASAGVFMERIDPALLGDGPLNVVRLSLHPDGLAGHIVNFADYAGHMVGRLRRQVAATADPRLADLLAEVLAFPGVAGASEPEAPGPGDVVLPLVLSDVGQGPLRLFSTITVFGAPADVTVDELAIEAFYPADDHTAAVLEARAAR